MSSEASTNSKLFFIGQLFFSICLLLAIALGEVVEAKNNKQELTQKQLKDLKQQIYAVQKSLSAIDKHKSGLISKLRQVELNINKLSKEIFFLSKKITELEQQYKRLKQKQQQLQSQLHKHKKLLAGQVKASYNMGKQEYLKLLLNQQNPEVISRVITYYQYLNRARGEQIEKFTQLIAAINENQQQIQLKQQEIELQHHLRNEDKNKLEKTKVEQHLVIAKLSKRQKTESQKLKQLQQNEKQLNQLLKKLQKALENTPLVSPKKPFAKSKGKMKWPTRGKLRRLFGHWRSVNKVKWQGVIINNKEGSPVYSVSHGRVAYSDWLRGYGLLSIIDHGNGYMSLYGNNQTLLREVGDWVEAGEIIAKTGRSGGRRKAGLYFEIRRKGRPINPTRWCKKMPKR